MKKGIYLLLTFSVLIFIAYVFLNQKEFMYSETSPDGNYEVKVYTTKRIFAATGDGGMSSRTAFVVLLDKVGNEIGNSGDDPSSYREIEIDWEIGKNRYVSYGKGHGIDFKK